MKILISRTDSIGDVLLTLPLCGWIKQNLPKAEVHFLCQNLTVPIIEKCSYVDKVHVWSGSLPHVDAIIHVFPNKEIAKAARKAGIKIRIGTSHRLFHLLTCNKLVSFTRRKSNLHEAQLNFKLLKGLGIDVIPELKSIHQYIGWERDDHTLSKFLKKEKFNLIFHMKSRGSAKEWDSSNFLSLAKELPENFNIILTGTEPEKVIIHQEIPEIFSLENITDTTGLLNLQELISLIEHADGLLACSTGPLHIASTAGIHSLGLYPSQRPMHAGRWAPVGEKSQVLSEQGDQSNTGGKLNINIENVKSALVQWCKQEHV